MRYVLTICGLLGTAFTVYYILTCFGGMLRKRKPQGEYEDRIRIAAVVAARNEEAVIGDLVRSLKMQRYPSDLYDIYVIPNNCTDGTEQAARDAGARILQCTGRVSSKGEALKQAFTQLTAMNRYDAYCVFDADNLVDPMFFHHVNNARQAGCHVAQGFRDSKNPFDSWVSGSMSVFYWFMSRFFNESRARLNLSCHLNGTGFMVSDALIRDIGWNTGTLTEDLEFTALCALRGYRISWMPNARIYDEQPVRFRDSVVQRRRWTSGSLQCMRRYAKALVEKKTAASLDIGCLFLGNLLNYVGILSGVATVVALLNALREGFDLARYAPLLLAYGIGCWALCAMVSAVMFRLEGRLCAKSVPTILSFAFFALSWAIINVFASLTRPPRWKTIRHTRSAAMPRRRPERSQYVQYTGQGTE